MSSTHGQLNTLGIDPETLRGMEASAQFKQVRARFLRAALDHHPDRAGGDAVLFRAAHDAFEFLKHTSCGGARCLVGDGACEERSHDTATATSTQYTAEFYSECGATSEPSYAVELAKTSRGSCVVCTEPILKAAPRFGSLNTVTGSYGRWAHFSCFRVPSLIHCQFADPAAATRDVLFALDGLSLAGIAALSSEHINELIEAVMDGTRWAKTTKKKRAEIDATKALASAKAAPGPGAVVNAGSENKIVPDALLGKSLVLTGVFDAEGGVGMARGKKGIEERVVRAGGKCVGAVSKKTSFLVVGTLPGVSKVSKAQALGVPLITPAGLETLLTDNGDDPEHADLDGISYSKGFGGNGLAQVRLCGEPAAKRICQ